MSIKCLIFLASILLSAIASGQDDNTSMARDVLREAYGLFNDSQNYEESRIYIDKAIDLMPSCSEGLCDEPPCEKELCSQAWYLKALTYAEPRWEYWEEDKSPKESEHLASLECCDKALAINPNYKEALSQKAWHLIELSRYDESLDCLDRALVIDPHYDEALELKSYLYFNEGKYQEALYWADKAIYSNPDWSDSYYWRSMNLDALGRRSEADEARAESAKAHYRAYRLDLD